MIAGFCSSERSVLRSLAFCSLTTPFIRKPITSKKQFLKSIHSTDPFLMNSSQQIPVVFNISSNRCVKVFQLFRNQKLRSMQISLHRCRSNLYHSWSVTNTESRITLKDIFILFNILLTCSRSIIFTTESEVSSLEKGWLLSKNIWKMWKGFLQRSTNASLSHCYGFRFEVSWQNLRSFINNER